MNDTSPRTAEAQIHAFADAVRSHLADLPGDDVDDLVDGLVGDLTDQAADHGGDIDLGDPAAYAHELRSAAGLPEPTPAAPPTETWRQRARRSGRELVERIRAVPSGSAVLDFMLSLRPLWWIVRGFALFATVSLFLGFSIWTMLLERGVGIRVVAWTLLLFFVVVSVQWGRGRWLPQSPLRHIRTAASILTVIILSIAVTMTLSILQSSQNEDPSAQTHRTPGLAVDGERVSNLFVYDKDGNPVPEAQIYTGSGKPLDLLGTGGDDTDSASTLFGGNPGETTEIPYRDSEGRTIWNVYPLPLGRLGDDLRLVPGSTMTAQPPFLRAPQRVLTDPTTGPSPTPTPTLSPDPSPTSTPTPSPAPTR